MFSLDQYKAAKESAVSIDRSAQGKLSLTGADRGAFLHALLTNDIARLTPGTGCYAACLTPQGRMISDMRVLETGDEMLVEVEGSVAQALADRLERLVFSEDVQVRNVTSELGEIGVHGPAAAHVLERVMGTPVARLQSLNQYDNVRAPGSPVTIVRDDASGVPGFDIYMPAADASRLAAALTDAGARACNDETAEVLRVEAGRPRFGVDMDTETIPLEAGLEDRAISLTKGCYVGQEVIVRVLHRGHGRVAQRLTRLVFAGERVPVSGDLVFSGDQKVGRVTSAADSPLMHAPIALGYVRREFLAEGTELTVKSGDHVLHARVHQF